MHPKTLRPPEAAVKMLPKTVFMLAQTDELPLRANTRAAHARATKRSKRHKTEARVDVKDVE